MPMTLVALQTQQLMAALVQRTPEIYRQVGLDVRTTTCGHAASTSNWASAPCARSPMGTPTARTPFAIRSAWTGCGERSSNPA